MMSGIGIPEMLIVLVIALIVLGPKKLPEVGRSVGRGLREFRAGLSGVAQDDHRGPEDDDGGAPAPRRPGDAAEPTGAPDRRA